MIEGDFVSDGLDVIDREDDSDKEELSDMDCELVSERLDDFDIDSDAVSDCVAESECD